ncbi:MAG TPA: hypothetical protein PLZ43_04930 [bacterium]|nr:hypothetical protein [bacterium]
MAQRKIYILHIDDRKDHHDTIVNTALRYGFQLDYCPNLTDGYKVLLSTSKYSAVILDGEAQISAEKASDFKFVSEARVLMQKLASEKGRDLPYLFYTAYRSKVDEMVYDIPVIDKKAPMEDLFEALKKLLICSDEYRIRKEHDKVFQIFEDGYLSEDKEEELLRILLKYNSHSEVKSILSLSRSFLETVLKEMAIKRVIFTEHLIKYIDSQGYDKEGYALNDYLYFLKAEHRTVQNNGEKAPYFICETIWLIQRVCSAYGPHDKRSVSVNVDNETYKITLNTAKTVVYSLLDFLLWFKDVMDRHTNDKK